MRLLSLLLCMSILAGCSSSQVRTATYDQISSELRSATDKSSKPKGVSEEAVIQALMPPLQIDALRSGSENVETRFDLAISNAPAQQVFMALVSGTRYSMLLAPDVGGSVSLNLKNVTVREALETLRDLYGYDFRIQGSRITVLPNSMQTRVFQVNYLAGRRQGASDVRVTSSSISLAPSSGSSGTTGTVAQPQVTGGTTGTGGGSTRVQDSSRVYTSQDADFWSELKTALGAIVGSDNGRNVIVNAHSGVILVRAMPNELRNVEHYLRATQAIIERQVMLEAKIIDVQLSSEYQSGINWASFRKGVHNDHVVGGINGGTVLQPRSGTLGNMVVDSATGTLVRSSTGLSVGAGASDLVNLGTKGVFGLAFQTGSFAALLNFLESQGNAQVLSSPRIATLNNQKAVLKVGTDEYYVTNVSSTTVAGTAGGTTTTPTVTLQPFFSGIALDVTPQIDENNLITLHIHPSISVVSEKEKNLNLGTQVGSMTLPLATSKINESDTIVRVRDGEIVAIGGLMSQDQSDANNGLPGMSQSSILGALFGQRNKAMNKRELVILLKPTVIQNDGDWTPGLRDVQFRLQDYDPRSAAVQ